MEDYVVYHHNDIDGHAAAWNVLLNIKPNMIDVPAETFIEMDYDSPFDQDHKGKTVFIVDISFTTSTIIKLFEIAEKAEKVIWIDHHHSSIEAINLYKYKLDNLRNLTYFVHEGVCGAALTFMYFYLHNIGKADSIYFMKIKQAGSIGRFNIQSPKGKFEVSIPKYLSYIDDFDCWKNRDSSSENYILGIECRDYRITVPVNGHDKKIINYQFWKNIANNSTIYQYLQDGTTVKEYLTQKYKRDITDGFESTWNDMTVFCMNSRGNSQVFGKKIYEYPFVVLFEYSGEHKKFVYSLYSEPIGDEPAVDCSKIAEEFGGGGHPKAAGFSSDHMVFLPK